MSAPWARATSFFTNIPVTLDPEYSYAPYEEVGGKTAAEVLKQVDKILQTTNTVLENHKDYLPSTQFSELKKAYCRYHWQMTNESQEDRTYYDQRIRESRILSQLYADRATQHDRAKILLREVETYQTRVLSASRNAQLSETLVKFEDELTESISTGSKASALQSYTSWFSLFGRPSRSSSTDIEIGQAQSDPAPAYDAEVEGFIVSVTHFPSLNDESVGIKEAGEHPTSVIDSKKSAYRRVLFTRENETYIDENTLQSMSGLAQRLLNQADPKM
ncbi:hypothetical protein RHS04_06627 [Rhizoctonia solani]|uniref:Uncharacterized protein n=1 Tax=Rhizoctonia solani TaxID=456999 RepID=A0A8H7H7D8_9AGAM|nr:hypothetical protein RHS04_06627 [Rhizoctonia solani]